MKIVGVLIATVIFAVGCVGIQRYGSPIFIPRNNDPGLGVLVNQGKSYLDIELYRYDPTKRKYYLQEMLYLEPMIIDMASELWIRLQPGKYQLVVYPYMGRWKFRKALKRREYYLEIDEDPTDEVYRGKYVGWLKKIKINR